MITMLRAARWVFKSTVLRTAVAVTASWDWPLTTNDLARYRTHIGSMFTAVAMWRVTISITQSCVPNVDFLRPCVCYIASVFCSLSSPSGRSIGDEPRDVYDDHRRRKLQAQLPCLWSTGSDVPWRRHRIVSQRWRSVTSTSHCRPSFNAVACWQMSWTASYLFF